MCRLGAGARRGGQRGPVNASTRRLVLAAAVVALVVASCGVADTAKSNGGADEGNRVVSWCAKVTTGYRLFASGSGDSSTLTAVVDTTCKPQPAGVSGGAGPTERTSP